MQVARRLLMQEVGGRFQKIRQDFDGLRNVTTYAAAAPSGSASDYPER